jgi:hypothetical protein
MARAIARRIRLIGVTSPSGAAAGAAEGAAEGTDSGAPSSFVFRRLEAFDILLDDPPAWAGALDLAQVDPTLLGYPARQRRRLDPFVAGLAVALAVCWCSLRLRAGWRLLRGGRRRGGLGLLLFLRGRRGCLGWCSAVAYDRDWLADRHGLALGYQDLLERAALERLQLHSSLVSLNLGDDLTVGNRVTGLLQPTPDRALRHGVAEPRHGYFCHRPPPSSDR